MSGMGTTQKPLDAVDDAMSIAMGSGDEGHAATDASAPQHSGLDMLKKGRQSTMAKKTVETALGEGSHRDAGRDAKSSTDWKASWRAWLPRAYQEGPDAAAQTSSAWDTAAWQDALPQLVAGFPTRKMEAYRYTDVAQLEALAHPWPALAPAAEPKTPKLDAASLSCVKNRLKASPLVGSWDAHIVLVDGVWHPELGFGCDGFDEGQKTIGLDATSLANCTDTYLPKTGVLPADPRRLPFVGLNRLGCRGGARLIVDGSLRVAVSHVFVQSGVCHPRVACVLKPQANLALVERLLPCASLASAETEKADTSPDALLNSALVNSVLQIEQQADSSLEHTLIDERSAQRHWVAAHRFVLERGAQCHSRQLLLGGGQAHRSLDVAMVGREACFAWHEVYVGSGRGQSVLQGQIAHRSPGGRSGVFGKAVLGDKAQSTFDTKVWVLPDAQQTDSQQQNRNLLLSPKARVHTRPQLEIYADDVKCAHGATVSALEPEQLFYLRSRGFSLEQAYRALVEGFAADVVDGIVDPELRKAAQGQVAHALRVLAQDAMAIFPKSTPESASKSAQAAASRLAT